VIYTDVLFKTPYLQSNIQRRYSAALGRFHI